MNLNQRLYFLSFGLVLVCIVAVWNISTLPKTARPLTFTVSDTPTINYLTPTIEPLIEEGWVLSERIRIQGLSYSFILLKRPWFPMADGNTQTDGGIIGRSWLILTSDDKEEFVLSISDDGLNDSYESILSISPASGYWIRPIASKNSPFELVVSLVDEKGNFISDHISLVWNKEIRRFQSVDEGF